MLKPESSLAVLPVSPLSLQPTGLMQSRGSTAPGLDLRWKWGKLSFRMKAQKLTSEVLLIRKKVASQLRSSTYSQIRFAQNTEFLLTPEVQLWGLLNTLCSHCNNSPHFADLQPSGTTVKLNFIHTENK